MVHIRQKGSNDSLAYTVVDTSDWMGDLSGHPSIVEHPELFEIVDEAIPTDAQYLKYTG